MAPGVNFYPSGQVRWRTQAIGAALTAAAHGLVNATVATVAAPGVASGAITATIHWGDGAVSQSRATGRGPTGIRLNSLYTVHGQHSYAHSGLHHGTVILHIPHQPPVTVTFTVQSAT
jgi:hypothetical protein